MLGGGLGWGKLRLRLPGGPATAKTAGVKGEESCNSADCHYYTCDLCHSIVILRPTTDHRKHTAHRFKIPTIYNNMN